MACFGGPYDISPGLSLFGDSSDPKVPLQHLETVRTRLDSLRSFLAESINGDIILGKHQMDAISSEIAMSIEQVILNGSSLLSSLQQSPSPPVRFTDTDPNLMLGIQNPSEKSGRGGVDDCDVVELDAVEIMAEHVHFCEICGKGFKRDANLRMHMRAHGDQYKTTAALSKPSPHHSTSVKRKTVFSCPYKGCNRNQRHKRFWPLKSVMCVKSHFKRSHCAKLFACHRCRKKSFSVLADLKVHMKHCGKATTAAAAPWQCTCGTSFTRKDKLFGHVANFEGHMPAVTTKSLPMDVNVPEERESETMNAEEETPSSHPDVEFTYDWLHLFDPTQDFCFEDILESPFDFS